VTILMNVLLVPTTVMPTPNASTPTEDSHANVTVVSRETAKNVLILMNVREALPNVTRTPSVTTPKVVSNVHARLVSLVMAQAAPMLTNVLMVPTTVMPTPPVPTLLVDSTASAVPLPITSRTSMATDEAVKTATNAKPEHTHVTTKPSVPIPMVVSHANVNPDSLEMDTGVQKQPPKQHQLHPRQPQWLELASHEAPTTVTPKPNVPITITVHSLANAKVTSLETVSSAKNQPNNLVVDQEPAVVLRELASPTLNKLTSRLICKTLEVSRTKCSTLSTG